MKGIKNMSLWKKLRIYILRVYFVLSAILFILGLFIGIIKGVNLFTLITLVVVCIVTYVLQWRLYHNDRNINDLFNRWFD